jgi:diguanylate cyclase
MTPSERQFQTATKLFQARELLTAITLIIALFVTYKIWETSSRSAEQVMASQFELRANEMQERIQQRLLIYEQVLRATVGIFRVAPKVDQADFQAYASELRLDRNYPGIQGLGFSEAIPPEQLDRHVRAIRAQSHPDYAISPQGQRSFYTSIVFLEPFAGRNLRAFGYDMYSEPIRRAAMELARDTGEVAVSGKVHLIQENGKDEQAGFLMYAPVYRNGTPHDTLTERQTNLAGWVFAPFRVGDFMAALRKGPTDDLDIELYAGTDITEQTRLFDTVATEPPTHRTWRHHIGRLAVGSQQWTVVISAMPHFDHGQQSERPLLVLQAGISISLLIALLVWLFLDDRARALHAAHQAMELALYDALTGLPNRKLLDERLHQAIASAKRAEHRLALLFIDLDKFKPVNDTYGHAYGDLLLKEVAKRLQGCMRQSDTAARLGGDEFVALLVDVEDGHAAMRVGEKILHQLNLPYEFSGHVFHISASIGGGMYPEHATDAKALMKVADMAMYEAKNAGRSNVKMAHSAALI